MSRLARSVCGLSAENRSAFDTAVLFLRWHQLAANPLLYRKLCALVSHEITESRLELKPGKMSTLDLGGWVVSLVFSLLPESFFIIFPSGVFGTAYIWTLSLLYICMKPRAINSDLLRYKRLILVFSMCRHPLFRCHPPLSYMSTCIIACSWELNCSVCPC